MKKYLLVLALVAGIGAQSSFAGPAMSSRVYGQAAGSGSVAVTLGSADAILTTIAAIFLCLGM